ncbi:MAG TPA: hypothetical protein VFP63_09330 [Dehalococcoidia bacterium]|nr:hypothetical protein [Dehalococcoidia bacterium]
MDRARAYLVSIAFAAAVALPVLGSTESDSFPLSTYPMFSGRQSAEADIPHAVAITEGGERRVLPPDAILNDEVIQAFETLRQAIADGPEATHALCERIAARAGRPGDVAVEIVTDRYDAIRYFEGDEKPLRSTVHASCKVDAQ